MDIKLNDTMGRGHFIFSLTSHKMSDHITIKVHRADKEKPTIYRLDREALVKAIGAMK